MKRRNIFESLYEQCPSEIKFLVTELKEQMKNFYTFLDWYQNASLNSTLFYYIYIEDKYQTNEEILFRANTNKNTLYSFISKNEDFVKAIIAKHLKYNPLSIYIIESHL